VEVGRVEKMSKSKKNIIDPNELVEQYGADTVRLFCLFAAPPERDLEWSEQGVEGGFRFLNRIWRLAAAWMEQILEANAYKGSPDQLNETLRPLYIKTHQAIKKVTDDIEARFHFNTAISAVMELVNAMYALESRQITPENADESTASVMRFSMETVLRLLAPVVPHCAEEIWAAMGHEAGSLANESWPEYRQDSLLSDTRLIVVQVNGKLRAKFEVDADADDKALKTKALEDENVVKFLGDKPVKKIIIVKHKLVNIVV
jgi:leucyl-tRNA synthetase